MRFLLLMVASVFVAGCVQASSKSAMSPVADEKLIRPDCYSVDLFTNVSIEKPAENVPAAYQQFLGNWGAGAWDGAWCHDLMISKVEADGRVELVDMHAPYAPWGAKATAYRRVGRIDKDGNLRFAYGTERRSYRIENGRMYGVRSGTLGELRIILSRRGEPPVPIPAPGALRLAKASG